MARPKNADGQRTRQAILDAALDLFAANGYFGTSLRDVASAVGVRESALYNYFAGKAALFDALLDAHQTTKRERLAPLADGPIKDGRTLLLQLAHATLDSYRRAARGKAVPDPDVGRHPPRQGRPSQPARADGPRPRAHARHHVAADSRRLAAPADVNMLSLAFLSPLIVWRQLHAIDANLPMIKNPRAFARQHVDQFLTGAAAPARATPVSSARAATRRRGVMTTPGVSRVLRSLSLVVVAVLAAVGCGAGADTSGATPEAVADQRSRRRPRSRSR